MGASNARQFAARENYGSQNRSCCGGRRIAQGRKRLNGLRVSRSRGLGRGVIDEVLQLFAGLEVGNLLRGHFDFFSRLRIAPDTPAALPRAETAEAANLDFFSLLQSTDDAVENRFDDGL